MKIEQKKRTVDRIAELASRHSAIGVLDVSHIPAKQLQNIRAKLRGEMLIFMAKRRIIRIALEHVKQSKKGAEGLEPHLTGMPALVFTNMSPFKLASLLRASRTPAPAKPGQIAPRDIVIPAGATAFSPGPIIGELGSIGIKTGVEGGKIAIRQEHMAARKGDTINRKTADVLAKLGILPMEIGLNLKAAYEDGLVFTDALEMDEKRVSEMAAAAAQHALSVALEISYATKDTIELLIRRAHGSARSLAMHCGIATPDTMAELVATAALHAQILQDKFIKEA